MTSGSFSRTGMAHLPTFAHGFGGGGGPLSGLFPSDRSELSLRRSEAFGSKLAYNTYAWNDRRLGEDKKRESMDTTDFPDSRFVSSDFGAEADEDELLESQMELKDGLYDQDGDVLSSGVINVSGAVDIGAATEHILKNFGEVSHLRGRRSKLQGYTLTGGVFGPSFEARGKTYSHFTGFGTDQSGCSKRQITR